MITDEQPSYKELFCSNCGNFRPLRPGWKTVVSKNGKIRRKICPDCAAKAELINQSK